MEFDCADCGAHVYVYTFESVAPRTRCHNCRFVRNMELPPDQEAELRKVLGVELPPPSSAPEPETP